MVILEVNTYLLPFEVKLPSFNSYVVCNAPDAKGVRGRKRGREVLAKASPSPGRLRSHLLVAQMTDKPGDKHTDIQTGHPT